MRSCKQLTGFSVRWLVTYQVPPLQPSPDTTVSINLTQLSSHTRLTPQTNLKDIYAGEATVCGTQRTSKQHKHTVTLAMKQTSLGPSGGIRMVCPLFRMELDMIVPALWESYYSLQLLLCLLSPQ
jgi:hypothetical protein